MTTERTASPDVHHHQLFSVDWPDSPHDTAAWRAQINAYNEWAAEHFLSADIETLVHDRAHFFDALLQELWTQLEFDSQRCALLAVGGYGRGTLHPGSDIDLLFLYQRRLRKQDEQRISQLITLLWDMRIEVGHSVRTVANCMLQAAADITIATTLIESRFLVGNEELSEQLSQKVAHEFPWQSQSFYEAKREEQVQRHRQYHGTSYNLEPNIKSSPGGLRDVQTIGWIAKQHFKTRNDESLVEFNYITAAEFVELRECTAFLWRIRYALHIAAGKCEDRLLFDYQPEVARILGYGSDGKHAVEHMMKDYFNVVLKVSELNRMLLQFFEQAILGPVDLSEPQPLDANFAISGQLIMARHDDVFADDVNILRFFLLIARNKTVKGIHSHTIRLLRDARARLHQPLSENPECRKLFRQLAEHPGGFGRPFALMHRHGIMACYLEAWGNIVGQMQFDLFHAYTVDEHTFRLIRNLYRFTLSSRKDEFPLCSELVESMQKPELLFIAGIFHDIAKGRGGDHSELGAQDARVFMSQHDYNEEDGELVAWLVENHLLMSVTAQKRDIYDPEVIQHFAKAMQSRKRLAYLYCLTVADIRATNTNLWNNWKATLLEELFRTTDELLKQGDKNKPDVRKQVNDNKHLAMGLLLSGGFSPDEINQLWGRFTVDYFYRHTPEQIAWHTQHIIHIKPHELPLILIGDENNTGTTELFIYHHEESHLFANVASVIDTERLNIHDAQILNTRDGYVMDTFILLQSNGEPLRDPLRIEEVTQHLHDVLRKRRSPSTQQRPLSRRMRNFSVSTRVNFLPQKNARRTTFELIALDRPGLIAKLARVLQKLDITLLAARISTVGEQAEDLFIVTSENQQALSESERKALEDAIIAELD